MNETDYSRYTVLIVDDIPVNVLLVKGMLSKLKFNTISANSGLQALDLLTRTRPDIILMDILMPGMNGFEATKAIRANPATSDIPVIILSALNSDSDIKEGLSAGANEFITKPFIQERIVNSIINQINLSESHRKENKEKTETELEHDTVIRLIACMAYGGKETFAHFADMALCLPLPLLDESFYALPDYTPERLASWAAVRIREMNTDNGQVSVNSCLSGIIDLLAPAAAIRNVVFKVEFAAPMNVTADTTLFKVLCTNLLSYACGIASGEILVGGTMEGGLANIVVSFMSCGKTTASISLRKSIALEVAEKINGTVVCDESDAGRCIFQIIVQA